MNKQATTPNYRTMRIHVGLQAGFTLGLTALLIAIDAGWMILIPVLLQAWTLWKAHRLLIEVAQEAAEFEEITDRVIHKLTDQLRQERDHEKRPNTTDRE